MRARRLVVLIVASAGACGAIAAGCSSGDTTYNTIPDATSAGGAGPTSTHASSSSGMRTCYDGELDQQDCACDPKTKSRACFGGNPSQAGVGACVMGSQACVLGADLTGKWGPCEGWGRPATEVCEGSVDEDCDGTIDNGCTCTDGASRMCTSPSGDPGLQVCTHGKWSACSGGECGPGVTAGLPCAMPGDVVSAKPNTCGCPDLGVASNTLYCDPSREQWACFPEPPPALCAPGMLNAEPAMFLAFEPASGATIASSGTIKVWITDECPPFIAPGETIDPTTGAIQTPGNRGATAMDGYLLEPALYVAPDTAESGGAPHFPDRIAGDYNNVATQPCGPPNGFGHAAIVDPIPSGSPKPEAYVTELSWNVSSLGLSPGAHVVEIVAHDGDVDRGVGCLSFVVK